MAVSSVRGQGFSPTGDAAIVADATVDPVVRSDAARRLLLAENDAARRSVLELLKANGGLTEVQRLLIGEISRLSWAPARLGKPLKELLQSAKADDRLAVIGALGSVRTPESARALLETAASTEAGVSEAALSALIRMTGRSDLGQDLDAWRAWFAGVEFLDEGAWQRTLAESLAARSDQLGRAHDSMTDRLVREKRDRFWAIPVEDAAGRSRYIADLLKDEAGKVRQLGVSLAIDELANTRPPGPAVSEAALAMLSDPQPRFRRMGADLLRKLAPEDAGTGTRLNDALIRETDPAVAAALLAATTRWPEARTIPVVLRWLENGPVARPAALAAVVELDKEGLLTNQEHIRRAMQAVRGMEVREMGASGVRLLARRGGAADLEWISGVLGHEDAGIRMAAAEGLATRREGVDPLLAAAANDPALFTTAAAALMQHRCEQAGMRALLSLPAPSPEVRLERIAAMAAALPPEAVCLIGCDEPDAETRAAILAHLEAAARLWADSRPWTGWAYAPVWLRGVLELAETRLQLGRPAEALEALQPIDSLAMETSRTAPIRAYALIWLNRLDEAEGHRVPAEVWVRALERIAGLPHAPAAFARFEAMYADAELDENLRTRIARIRERMAAAADGSTGVNTAPAQGPS